MGQSLSRNAIWDLIAPAVPDSLEDLGKGQYLAKWWKPVPMDDVELLVRNQGIRLHLEPFEPRDLPQGIAVLFSVVDAETPGSLAEHVSAGAAVGRARLPLRKTGS